MWRALCLTSDSSELYAVELSLESESELKELRLRPTPAIYVFDSSGTNHLRQYDSVVVDLGARHPKRPLKQYFLAVEDKIPILDGGYLHSGRLRSSATKFLSQAVAAERENVYFLMVSKQLFSTLWNAELERETVETDATSTDGDMSDPAAFALFESTMVGDSPQLQALRENVRKAANSDANVSIEGESGTGKELVAKFIHTCGKRRAEPFVALNIAAIPRENLEAELFGWEPGAFTGALGRKLGLWVIAGKGTLFLDEIGDLEYDLQVKILRVLQEKELRALGGEKVTKVHARVVTSTKRDLAVMVTKGWFREELYWRLVPLTLRTPALRERRQDIPIIAQRIWTGITHSAKALLSDAIRDRLSTLSLPGNVRELEALLERLYVFFNAAQPTLDDLEAVLRLHKYVAPAGSAESNRRSLHGHKEECLDHLSRVDQVVRSIKVSFRPISETRREWGVAEVARDLAQSPEELIASAIVQSEQRLDRLCEQPLLFYDSLVFNEVYKLKGQLLFTIGLFRRDVQEVKRYYKRELKDQVKTVHELLFRTVHELLSSV